MRTFVSLNLDEKTRKIVSEYLDKFKSLLDDRDIKKIKWEPEDKFHITLFFIGDINESMKDNLINDLNEISNLEIGEINFTLKNINAFPDLKNPRVLFVDCINKDTKLSVLYKNVIDIMTKNGLKQDKRLKPHITIGRVRKNENVHLDNVSVVCNNEKFVIRDLFLMNSLLSSEGSKFGVIHRIRL